MEDPMIKFRSAGWMCLAVFLGTLVLVFGCLTIGWKARGELWQGPKIEVNATVNATPNVSVDARLPDGAVQVTNNLPATQIHEIVKDRVQVPDVKIENKSGDVKLTLESPKGPVKVEVVNLPSMGGVMADDEKEFGKLLPPIKGK